MVHDPSSRATARNLLAESDVVASEELTVALAELRGVGQRPAPPISPALAEAMRQAAVPGDRSSESDGNVVPLRSRKAKRRGAAVSGVVVLAMAAGMGGVAALGPGNAVETAIESVIRWVAPSEPAEPASDKQPDPAQPAPVPAPDVTPVPQAPVSAPAPEGPGAVEPGTRGGEGSPAAPEPTTSAEPEIHAPADRKGTSKDLPEVERRVVPPVELPELPVEAPRPVPTPRSVLPVDPPGLTVPGGTPKPAPSAEPSR